MTFPTPAPEHLRRRLPLLALLAVAFAPACGSDDAPRTPDGDADASDVGDGGRDGESDIGHDANDATDADVDEAGDADDTDDGDAGDTADGATDADAGGDDADADSDGSVEDVWELDVDGPCNVFSTSNDCLLPVPAMQFTVEDPSTPTGVRLSLRNENFVSPDGALPVDISMFNVADGWSPATPILVNFGRDVDPAFLNGPGDVEPTLQPGAPIALMHAETGELVPLLTEMDRNNRNLTAYRGRWALILRPMKAMQMGERYLVVLRNTLTDTEGVPFDSPDAFVALRDGIPTSSARVEGMRERYEQLFETAENAGWPREELLLAWEFQVASERHVLGPIRSARAQALAAFADGDISWTIDRVQVDLNANVHRMVEGTFSPPNFLTTENELVLDGAGGVAMQEGRPSYDFTLVVPPLPDDEEPLALVLIGHGLFGRGRGLLQGGLAEEYTQPIAANVGAVLVATDWIGLSGGDTTLIVERIVPDLSRIRLITDRLVQSHVNNIILVEAVLDGIIQDPALGLPDDREILAGDRVYYYGNSLGGIQGTGQTAISPRISRSVVAVPGSGWTNMIQRSTNFALLDQLIDLRYPDPLSQQAFIAMLQGFFDFSDPVNLGLLLHGDEDMPDAPAKVLVIQEAIGDCQVPNIATDLLSRTIRASHLEFATDPVFGLETITGPTTALSLTQVRVPDALAEYFPPDQNLIPARDNGVHNSAVIQPAMFRQIEVLMTTGEIIHPCDGLCDPQ